MFRFIQCLGGKKIFVLFVIKKNTELEHQSGTWRILRKLVAPSVTSPLPIRPSNLQCNLRKEAVIYSKWMFHNKMLLFRCMVPAQLTSTRPYSKFPFSSLLIVMMEEITTMWCNMKTHTKNNRKQGGSVVLILNKRLLTTAKSQIVLEKNCWRQQDNDYRRTDNGEFS